MNQQLRTILIIDDCQEDRDTYRRYLLQESRYTYQILEEQYGEDGLEVCRVANPDVILLDFLLPDIDGLEFLEELRTLTGMKNLPVIMFTGQGSEQIAVQAMKNGVQDYLVKNQTTPETLRLAIRNVLERSRLLLKLEESEERFRTSVENLLDAFGIYRSIRDQSGQIVDFYIEYVNAAACQAHQMTKEQQIGQRLGEILPMHRESGLLAEYCRVVETGEPLVKESLVYPNPDRKLGATRVFDIRATRLGDRLVVAWRDITERQQAAEKIRQGQQFVERITETLPGVLYIYDLQQGHNVFVNPQIESMLGYTPQEIRDLGDRLFPKLVHPEDLAKFSEHVSKLRTLKAGEVVELEYRFRHRNGEWRWLLSRETVFARTDDGEPKQSLGIATDITARKQAEAALKLSNERFALAADAVNCLIYDWDLARGTIERTRGLTEILGYGLAEAGSDMQWWLGLIHPDDRANARQAITTALAEQERYALEYRVRHRDGHYVYILDRGLIVRDRHRNLVRVVGSATDISDRKASEAALRQSEARFRRLAESNIIGVAIGHLDDGKVLYANDAFLDLVGYTQEDLQAGVLNWHGLTPAEYRTASEQRVAQIRHSGVCHPSEKEYIRKDGSRVPALVGRAILEENDQALSVAFVLDLRERKQYEEALRQSEARFRRLVESNIIGIVFTYLDGSIIDANDAYLDLIGYTQADIRSETLNWRAITPPEHLPRDEQAIQELKHTGICVPFEKEYIRKDGSRVPILLGCALLEQDNEQAVAFVLDLSDRKAAEVALQESEQRFRSLADTVPQIIWTTDAEGACDYVNQRWCETTGLTFEQSLGWGWQQAVHPDDLQWYKREGQAAFRSGSFTEKEYRYRQADGSYRWYLVRALPIRNEHGQVVKWVGSSTDIEERKQFESERAQLLACAQAAQAEAEAANRAKDDFVAMVSHDLRAPLNAILGWATLLRTRPQVEDKTQQALETIERNAKAQAQLLEDLLDVSRMVQGRLQIDMRPIALQPIVQAALIAAYPTAQAKGIHLESALDASVLKIEGDPHRLQQVLGNLLSNAVKFTPKGGWVKVCLERVAARAHIVVSDTGKGISPELLPHVFDRFRQGQEVVKKEGLGLGLAIAQHLVELHGGTITAYSPGIGQGATFTICLPLLA